MADNVKEASTGQMEKGWVSIRVVELDRLRRIEGMPTAVEVLEKLKALIDAELSMETPTETETALGAEIDRLLAQLTREQPEEGER